MNLAMNLLCLLCRARTLHSVLNASASSAELPAPLGRVLAGAAVVAVAVSQRKQSVLVHCSDGWCNSLSRVVTVPR